jgi:hypothetical protein
MGFNSAFKGLIYFTKVKELTHFMTRKKRNIDRKFNVKSKLYAKDEVSKFLRNVDIRSRVQKFPA